MDQRAISRFCTCLLTVGLVGSGVWLLGGCDVLSGCSDDGKACDVDGDCCGDLVCDGGTCQEEAPAGCEPLCEAGFDCVNGDCVAEAPADCAEAGDACDADNPCCADLTCNNDVCE